MSRQNYWKIQFPKRIFWKTALKTSDLYCHFFTLDAQILHWEKELPFRGGQNKVVAEYNEDYVLTTCLYLHMERTSVYVSCLFRVLILMSLDFSQTSVELPGFGHAYRWNCIKMQLGTALNLLWFAACLSRKNSGHFLKISLIHCWSLFFKYILH